jgi:tRNA threonylcarbamoyladenosine biosynthesis protein TsaE
VPARWWLPGAADTARLGTALAAGLSWDESAPRLLYLAGELGTGKTTLAAALFHALGAEEIICSPSYALLETYRLRDGLGVHVDCYRLADAQELEQLGLRDYFRARTLWVVEWAERGGASLPPPDLLLRLEVADSGRTAALEPSGSAGAAWLGRTQAALTAGGLALASTLN